METGVSIIVMVGGGGPSSVEQAVAGACRAAARDTIERALEAQAADRIIVVTDEAEWASSLSDLPVTIDLEPSPVGKGRVGSAAFHFGKRLAGVIERHNIRRVFYLGGGSAPLVDGATLRAIADSIRHDDGVIVTNNIHSSDWAAFAPADAAVQCADQLRSDNSLGWVLSRNCRLTVREWPRSAATQFDLDTPTDLIIAGLRPLYPPHPSFLSQTWEREGGRAERGGKGEGIGPHLRAHIASLGWDDSFVYAARQALMTPAKQVIIAGRVPQSTLAHLESKTLCWVRVFSEEHGMRASGRLAQGLVRSLLADYVELVGLERFFGEMGELADAMFLDSRVIMAARKIWPSPADRFNSDLRRPDDIADPFLRDFTAAALAVAIPVVLGGHSLVSGGLQALITDPGLTESLT
jgi:CTP:molybdopterin cytidylyltransferase MocA